MLTRLIYGARLSLFMGITPVVARLRARHGHRRRRGLRRRLTEHGHHAHDRRLLRLPLGAAGHRACPARSGAGIVELASSR
jgi:hypothetical protein